MELVLPYAFCKLHGIALVNDNKASTLHYSGELNPKIISNIQHLFNEKIETKNYQINDFESFLTEIYSDKSSDYDLDNLDQLNLENLANSIQPSDDLLDDKNKGPIIKLINATITKAIKARASDIHLEPFENNLTIRFRVDGVLKEVLKYQKNITQMIISRIKIMSNLDISERRLPQDGRISINIGKKEVDLRVSTLPSSFGERVVLRILEKDKSNLELESLGFSNEIQTKFKNALSKNEGIILVTGPTGSGKTTTLYSGLKNISDRSQNILTIEDPVEYALNGIGQTQVNSKTGLTFAKGLRAILRQDPDVVMVGEIRDKETADIAIQASLTGHLVLSTVHTTSAVNAITRLRDMGIESFLLSSSLRSIISQRLVRRLCNNCKEEVAPSSEAIKLFNLKNNSKVFTARGCEECSFSGFQGRIAIAECIQVDSITRDLIHQKASESKIVDHVFKDQPSIDEASRELIISGITSCEEIIRLNNLKEDASL